METIKKIIVTGCNKGIGFGIIRNLVKKNYFIIMACRSIARAEEAKQQIIKEYPDAAKKLDIMEVDTSNFASIAKFVGEVEKKYKSVDILLNNAGMAFQGDEFDEHVARTTLQTNLFGTVELTEKMIPYINEHGKIITIGSQAGYLSQITKKELQDRFLNPNITVKDLLQLGKEFIEDVKNNVYESKGWKRSAYCASKLLLNTYVTTLAKVEPIIKKNIQVYVCCPGWVKTDLGGMEADLTVEEGIQTPVYLVELPHVVNKDLQGKFFFEKKVVNFQALK